MVVTFYGTRGSTPMCETGFSRAGGNTSCVLVNFGGGRIVILDAGTGIRKLGNDIVSGAVEHADGIYIGLSHTHWDHIQGFPFFKPAYDPQQRLTLSICGKGRHGPRLESLMAGAMQLEYFPVPMDRMGARITFWEPDVDAVTTPFGVTIRAARHGHPGGAFGYRLEDDGKSLVYCTDVEHGEALDSSVVELAEGADLLIHDAQFTSEELKQKKGWGHSSWEQAVEVARHAEAKRLALFHHDPEHDDAFLDALEEESRKQFGGAFLAREGSHTEV